MLSRKIDMLSNLGKEENNMSIEGDRSGSADSQPPSADETDLMTGALKRPPISS